MAIQTRIVPNSIEQAGLYSVAALRPRSNSAFALLNNPLLFLGIFPCNIWLSACAFVRLSL